MGSVREMKWLDVEGWASKGGSEIGTNRGLPEEDLEQTARCFKSYELDALFIIGGFEAFTALRWVTSELPFHFMITLTPNLTASCVKLE